MFNFSVILQFFGRGSGGVNGAQLIAIGEVSEIDGAVSATGADGITRVLDINDLIYENDIIGSAESSSA